MTKTPLPEKLSALLRLAVKDARLLASRPDLYELDMSAWVTKANGEPCRVCMAGAVMVCERTEMIREQVRKTGAITPEWSGFRTYERVAFELINQMRAGNFIGCLKASRLIRRNYNDELGRAPWHIYLKAASILAKAGL